MLFKTKCVSTAPLSHQNATQQCDEGKRGTKILLALVRIKTSLFQREVPQALLLLFKKGDHIQVIHKAKVFQ